MPMHDWTKVDAGIFHAFHLMWIAEMQRALNGGLLPPEYYAMAEQVAGGMVPDVLTLRVPDNGVHKPWPSNGGVALAVAPPAVWRRIRPEEEQYAAMARTLTIRHVSDHRVVAMVEIVSSGNKSGRDAFRTFIRKTVAALQHGIHLLIVDPFPPGPRDPRGIHKAIWDELMGEQEFDLPADRPLMLAAYLSSPGPEAFIEPTTVGLALPDMPAFLTRDHYVPVPLEATYQHAWETMPMFWRNELTKPAG